ncbi:maleylpyruvate isomerase N-terminal domain-containing protein [Streptomyces sp. BPTC-684]|uniref:maleylpyruvate isomerase N-terminal domain-containing protein n=1 Tax=Streptomyces sp. BPTC-684 TaxID=3043734 RepID=UPI0024B128A5|nr:maleylpyruvate isomerase N-terminal domain-containing protein [Streptomyces sp. BPTC-684]WHM41057.1 maleylpyruvate isomerase N-terminal domain-containing protein [Streptomyces sp. BPTC-684]
MPGQWLPASAGWRTAWQARTAEVIARTRAHAPERTLELWRTQSSALLASPAARDQAAARPMTLMGLSLPLSDHFLIRGFETWIHTVDIASALDMRVPPPVERHLTPLVHLAVRILRLAVGGRMPSVLLRVGTGAGDQWVLGRPAANPPTAELSLDPVDFFLLIGGRYTPQDVPRRTTGETAPAWAVLQWAAELAWP